MKGFTEIFRRLLSVYGPQGWWPVISRVGQPGYDGHGYHPGILDRPENDHDRLIISLGAILTQNTAWANAESALTRLIATGADDVGRLISGNEGDLAEILRPSGYFHQKTRKIKAFALAALAGGWFGRAARETSGHPSREALLSVWGIGPETADSILLYAFGIPAFVIDAYTLRIFQRIGLLRIGVDYEGARAACMVQLPLDARLFNEYHALIVRHAKEHCRKKPVCGGCPLLASCLHGQRSTKPERGTTQ